ncbi:MAG: aspartate dehydrogenase [Candidatus Altiarchaeales archaeon]|nr:aspartate dehydrogenase [Candidatus Altiarchaeales archaeon]
MTVRVGILGCGNIGSYIASALGDRQDIRVCALFDKEVERAQALCQRITPTPKVVAGVEGFVGCCDLVVEAAAPDAVESLIKKTLGYCDLIILSVGGLIREGTLDFAEKTAKECKTKLYVPSGAITGLDVIKASAKKGLRKVKLTTTKNPRSLLDVSYLKEKNIDLNSLSAPLIVFKGTAKDAVEFFPKNINVAAALSLCGVGVEETRVEIVADPGITTNSHEVEVEGVFGKMYVKLENLPSPENPKTSYLAALSVLRQIEEYVGGVKIGT